MWHRFTTKAKEVIEKHASASANECGEGYVSTEHILLGVLAVPDGRAYQTLLSMNINIEGIIQGIKSHIPRGDARPTNDLTITPRGKRVIDLAFDESRNLNNNFIGTEHILLGLIREGDGLAGRILAKYGVALEPARKAVMALQDNAEKGLLDAEERFAAAEEKQKPQKPQVTLNALYRHTSGVEYLAVSMDDKQYITLRPELVGRTEFAARVHLSSLNKEWALV